MKLSFEQVTPGLAASVSVPSRLLSTQTYLGRLGYGSTECVDAHTIYDLASLTKVLCTTLLSAVAIDLGKMGLDEKPWIGWPGVTVAHVLNHTAGLPAWKPLYDRVRQAGEWATSRGADLIIRAALDEKLVSVPGKQTVYSDLGFIALGRLLEERLGDRLDVLCADQFNRYYGDTDLAFNAKRAHTAPTTVSGAVDDMNCRAMGGVAGHAGLFGTLNSVERACEFFLRALQGNNLGVSAILRGFARYNSERPLGFDRPTPSGSTGGWLSEQSVGHLGSTGTSLWIDPAIGAIYVLLTNRMHFEDRDASGIKALRIQFHETAVNWLNETAAAENLRCQ